MIWSYELLRIFFMIGVVFTHLAFLVEPGNDAISLWIGSASGKDAVSFFFILSGFFMYRSLCKAQPTDYRSGTKQILRKNRTYFIYYLIRVLLVLVYYLILYFYSGIRNRTLSEIFSQFFLSLTMINNLLPGFATDVGWFFESLTVCYFMSIPLYRMVKKSSKSNVLWLLLPVIAVIYLIIFLVSAGSPIQEWITYYSPYIRLLDFLCGMTISALFLQKPDLLNRKTTATVLELAAIAFVLIEHFYVPYHLAGGPIPWHLWCYFLVNTAVIFIFAANRGLVSEVTNHMGWIRKLSRHGFAFYIFHDILLRYSTLVPWSPSKYLNLAAVIVVIIIGDNLFKALLKQRKEEKCHA